MTGRRVGRGELATRRAHAGGVSRERGNLVQARRLADYERCCAVIAQLTDVRFKLVAFVPTLTGAAVALLMTGEVEPFERGVLAFGGIGFVLGIVIYDLRNTQHYNSAIGRATELEKLLGLDVMPGDERRGVYGSRRDSSRELKNQERDRFLLAPRQWLTVPVRHATGLAVAYGAAFAAWVWTLSEAIVESELESSTDGRWIAVAVAAGSWLFFVREYRRVDTTAKDRERAIEDWERRWPRLGSLRRSLKSDDRWYQGEKHPD